MPDSPLDKKHDQTIRDSAKDSNAVRGFADQARQIVDSVHETVRGITSLVAGHPKTPRELDTVPFTTNNPLVTPELLGHMLDAAPVLSIHLEEDEDDPTIVWATRTIEHIFGFGPGELNGAPLSTILPLSAIEIHREHIRKFREHPHDRQLGELIALPCPQGRKKTGELFDLEVMLRVVWILPNTFTVATIMPQIRPALTAV